jgi:O-antigen/teichoic acid export membrane protein
MLKRNVIANFLGQGWTALMGLAFIPLYIKYIGIEAYGLIGLFSLLQACMSLLDMGMTPTLNREMARFTAGTYSSQSIRDLLRSIEIVALGIAIVVAGGVALGSTLIAKHWLIAHTLSVEVVAQAITVMGMIIALRLIEAIYRSCIVGLQRQVLFNIINSFLATFRFGGAVVVLILISPTVEAYFIWHVLVSLLTIGTLAAVVYGSLHRAERRARFSCTAILSVWRFAGGMIGISFLAFMLTHVDKILLSKLLSLGEYGQYTLAAIVAGALFLIVGPITQAFYPRLCEVQAQGDSAALSDTYHMGAQLVSVLAGSVGIQLILFSDTFLQLWTQDPELAAKVAPLVSLLTLGNLLNGMVHMPYHVQLAHGWTSFGLKVNAVAVLIIVPAILWATPQYGAEGAAWAWVTLNAGYVLIVSYYMFRRVLCADRWRWITQDLMAPLCASLVVSLLLKHSSTLADATALNQLLLLTLTALLSIVAATFAAGHVRGHLLKVLKSFRKH